MRSDFPLFPVSRLARGCLCKSSSGWIPQVTVKPEVRETRELARQMGLEIGGLAGTWGVSVCTCLHYAPKIDYSSMLWCFTEVR